MPHCLQEGPPFTCFSPTTPFRFNLGFGKHGHCELQHRLSAVDTGRSCAWRSWSRLESRVEPTQTWLWAKAFQAHGAPVRKHPGLSSEEERKSRGENQHQAPRGCSGSFSLVCPGEAGVIPAVQIVCLRLKTILTWPPVGEEDSEVALTCWQGGGELCRLI